MTKLFLHVGYPKTGTTSLQAFMSRNRGLLRTKGILYPETGIVFRNHYKFHQCLGYGDRAHAHHAEPKEALLEKLQKEIVSTGCDKVVMSSEYFIRVPPDLVRALFEAYDTKIVMYLRRHDLLLDTLFIQRYKSGRLSNFVTIEKYIETLENPATKFPFDFLAAIRNWERAFGEGNVIVRPFERGQNTPDLYQDFFGALGFAWDEKLVLPEREQNPTVSNEILAAIDAVLLSGVNDALKRTATVSLVELNKSMPEAGKTSRISYEQSVRILEKYAESYRVIASKYLGREGGELFYDKLPSAEAKAASQDMNAKPPSTDEIVGLILRALEPHLARHEPGAPVKAAERVKAAFGRAAATLPGRGLRAKQRVEKR